MANHKKTIPYYATDQCKNNCWWPNNKYSSPMVPITLKHNDIIRKR